MAEPARLAKLSILVGDEWLPNRFERVYWQEETTGPSRVVAAVSEDQVEAMLRLAACAGEPFLLLWVLRMAGAGSQRGRYQSPPLSFDELRRVLLRYRELFEQDGRSDIRVRSENPEVTVVLDQHDFIYAYGPEDAFISALAGFRNARAAIPSPHAHEYHAELDELERALAMEFDWRVSALRPEDDR